jgi:hypothetical protein
MTPIPIRIVRPPTRVCLSPYEQTIPVAIPNANVIELTRWAPAHVTTPFTPFVFAMIRPVFVTRGYSPAAVVVGSLK